MRNRFNLAVPVCAALIVASVSPLASAQPGGPNPAAVKTASTHFERGVALFEDGDFKLALVEFKRSYEAVADFRTLYNIGQVHFQLGDFAEARRTLTRYLEEGAARVPAQRRKDVEKDLEALKIRTALLRIQVDVEGADVAIDGQQIGKTPIREALLVNGGPHTISVTKHGYLVTTKDVSLAGTEERSLTLTLAPAPVQEVQVSSTGLGPVWVGWGLTAALAAGTAGMGVAWQSASSDLADAKGRPSSQTEREEYASSVDSRRAITLVLGGATLVAAGVSLFFTIQRPAGTVGSSRTGRADKPRFAFGPTGVAGTF